MKYVPNKRTKENSRTKKLNKIQRSNLPNIKFKPIEIRVFKENSENFNKNITNIKNT